MKRLILSLAGGCVYCFCVLHAGAMRQEPQGLIEKADGCGLVVDATGRPVPDVIVTATAGDFKVSASSLSDGSFSLPETTNKPLIVAAEAKGYLKVSETITHLEPAGERHCKRPVYIVLAPATARSASFMTVKKRDVPRAGKR